MYCAYGLSRLRGWAEFTAKCRRYLFEHGHTLLGFLPAGSADVETEDKEGGADLDVSRYGFFSLEDVPLETLISHTSLTSSRNDRISVLREAIRCILASLRNCSETGSEDSLKGGKVEDAFLNWCRTVAIFRRLKTCLSTDMKQADTSLSLGAKSVLKVWYRGGGARIVYCLPPLKQEEKWKF